MADPTDTEREEALVRALAELKTATEARRSLPHGSPQVLSALRRERRAMERVHELAGGLNRAGSGEPTKPAPSPDTP